MTEFPSPRPAFRAEHRVVYRNPSEFAAWPFNNGLWKTAQGHLLVGFLKNRCAYETPTDCSHRRSIHALGARLVVLRSEDGGASWDEGAAQTLAHHGPLSDRLLGAPGSAETYDGQPALDPRNPDILLASGSVPDPWGQDSRAWIRLSADGGRSWRDPILVPLCGFKWLQGRPATAVRPDGTWLLCLTANRPDGTLGRAVAFASADGGRNWTFLSYMAPSTDDHLVSCPQPLLLADGRIVAALRCQRTRRAAWTELIVSEDGGRSWRGLSRVNDWGAPADLVLLGDGRLVCVYGYRVPPYGVRARISEDGGRSWGGEIVLREDGGSWDVGYPRIVETEPGRLLAVYYINLASDPVQVDGGVRHIAQTAFSPD